MVSHSGMKYRTFIKSATDCTYYRYFQFMLFQALFTLGFVFYLNIYDFRLVNIVNNRAFWFILNIFSTT